LGGIGSGTWCRWGKRLTLEECHRIDVRYMKKHNFLCEGASGTLSWTRRGEPSGAISCHYRNSSLTLTYSYCKDEEAHRSVTEHVFVEWTTCHFGGKRPWLRCPCCNGRVMILARTGPRFLCRKCHNLPYGSQTEMRIDRLIRKARKIRKKVGASDDLQEPIWRKPKGMHQKTFDRYANEDEAITDEINTYIKAKFQLCGERTPRGFLL